MKPMINMSKTITLCLLATLAMAAYCEADITLKDVRPKRFGVSRGYLANSESDSFASQDLSGAQSHSSAKSTSAGYEHPTYQYPKYAAAARRPRRIHRRPRPVPRYVQQPSYYTARQAAPGHARAYSYADAGVPAYHQEYVAAPHDDYDQYEQDDLYEQPRPRRYRVRQPPVVQAVHPTEAQASAAAAASAKVSGKQASAAAKASARAKAEAKLAEQARVRADAAAAAEASARYEAESYLQPDDEEIVAAPYYDSDDSELGVQSSNYRARVSGQEDYEEDNEDGDSFSHADQYNKDEDEDAYSKYRNKEKDVYQNADEFRKKKKDVSFETNYSKKARENQGSQTASDKYSNSRMRHSKKTKKDVDQSSTKLVDGRLETETAQARGALEELDEAQRGTPRVNRAFSLRPSYLTPTFQKPTIIRTN